MVQERRFGRRIAEPSSVQIVHELKLMALRQSLDAATAREAAEMVPTERSTSSHVRVHDASDPSPSDGL